MKIHRAERHEARKAWVKSQAIALTYGSDSSDGDEEQPPQPEARTTSQQAKTGEKRVCCCQAVILELHIVRAQVEDNMILESGNTFDALSVFTIQAESIFSITVYYDNNSKLCWWRRRGYKLFGEGFSAGHTAGRACEVEFQRGTERFFLVHMWSCGAPF